MITTLSTLSSARFQPDLIAIKPNAAASHFQDLMNAPAIASSQATAASGASTAPTAAINAPLTANASALAIAADQKNAAAVTTATPNPVNTIGNKILDAFTSMGKDTAASWQSAARLGESIQNGEAVSSASLINAQLAILSATLEFDFMGKVVSKAASNIDSIVRTQ